MAAHKRHSSVAYVEIPPKKKKAMESFTLNFRI